MEGGSVKRPVRVQSPIDVDHLLFRQLDTGSGQHDGGKRLKFNWNEQSRG